MSQAPTLPDSCTLPLQALGSHSVLCQTIEGDRWHVIPAEDSRGAVDEDVLEPLVGCPSMLAYTEHLQVYRRHRYEIVVPLGVGGFSRTYLALDLSQDERPKRVVKQLRHAPDIVSTGPDASNISVASSPLKVGSARLDAAPVNGRSLFRAEAKLLRQLGHHPNIPTLRDAFEADGHYYLIQDYVEGSSLHDEFIVRPCYHESDVIKLLQQLLDVLRFIHGYGVIHRDIKPSNIIRHQSNDRLNLIDFGAVKQLTGQWHRRDIAIGTHSYAAPEQMERQPRINSDLYALGIVAIEALTGQPARTVQEHSTNDTLTADDLPVSRGLAQILCQLVEPDCRFRYQTAMTVLADLEQLQR